MAISHDGARQYPLTAVVNFTYADLAAGTNVAAKVPAGAVVTGIDLFVDEAWNSTTNTLSVGDAVSGTRYAATRDLKTTGKAASVATTGYKHVEGSKNIVVTYALTGAASTAGAARLIFTYVVDGKANEVQG